MDKILGILFAIIESAIVCAIVWTAGMHMLAVIF